MSFLRFPHLRRGLPPDYLIKEIDNCGFSRTSIRARYPALAAFASEIAFEDGDLIFSTFDKAERYYVSPSRSAEVHQLRRQLKLEASAFDDQFPVGHACRQRAWWALGANSGAPWFMARMINGLKACTD